MASVLAESWIQIWAQYRAYTSLKVYLKRKLFVMCCVELNCRFHERSKLTFILPGKWSSDRLAKIPRDFELIICIENYSKQVWRRVKMRSVREDDIVWIVDKSYNLALSYILEFFASVSYHNVRNSAVVMTLFRVKVFLWRPLSKPGSDRTGSDRINSYNPIPLNLLSF